MSPKQKPVGYYCSYCGHNFKHLPSSRVKCERCGCYPCSPQKIGGGKSMRAKYNGGEERRNRILANIEEMKRRRHLKFGTCAKAGAAS
jgi:hypothetical protein